MLAQGSGLSVKARLIALAFLVGVGCFLVIYAYASLDADRARHQIRVSEVDRAIAGSKDYLVRMCDSEGEFTYQVDEKTGFESKAYNIVRHCGAIYGLETYYSYCQDQNVLKAIVRASRFLIDGYIRSVGDGIDAVWPSSSLDGDGQSASLGGTALALVALSKLYAIEHSSIEMDKLEALGRFILEYQKPDGDYYGSFKLASGASGDNESLYYPGEAALGLISLYEVDHDRRWLVAAGRTLSFLVKSRQGLKKLPPDHWALIATAKFLPYYGYSECPTSVADLIDHSTRICESIIEDQIHDQPDSPLNGAFDRSGRSTAVATRLEGLCAALTVLPKREFILRNKIERSVALGTRFLIGLQFREGLFMGGIPRAIDLSQANKGGSFVPDLRATQIRIDYVQHALCEFIDYKMRY